MIIFVTVTVQEKGTVFVETILIFDLNKIKIKSPQLSGYFKIIYQKKKIH